MNIPQPPKNKKDEPVENHDDSSWAQDQELREYYYDDAHGYESYDPKEDEDSTKEIESDDPG